MAIIQQSDILIYVVTDTDNQSDVCILYITIYFHNFTEIISLFWK